MKKMISMLSYGLVLILVVHACQKGSDDVENRTRYGSYFKNELSVPVYVQNGYRFLWNSIDTIFISENQQLLPGAILKYNPYPRDLTGVTVPRTSMAQPANTVWITIGDKVKRDYQHAVNKDGQNDFSFFNYQGTNWIEIQHPELDSISRIYNINRNDSLQAQ